MNDISDLASLGFEDLAQADLLHLVTSSSMACGGIRMALEADTMDDTVSRSSSPVTVMSIDQEPAFTHITLINGEQICLRDSEEDGQEWRTTSPDSWDMMSETPDSSPDTMDLNSILQAGVVERVTSTVSDMDDLDWESVSSSGPVRQTSSSAHRTILASQLPLPVPARLRHNALVISSSHIDTAAANNNNSLLRSALIGKQSANGSLLLSSSASGEQYPHKTVLATVKTEGERGGGHVDDILLLSLEGREAVARLKSGAASSQLSQLFPNTRVSSDLSSDSKDSAGGSRNSVISIEVDGSGNLVLHRQPGAEPQEAAVEHDQGLDRSPGGGKGVRKYHRRSKEEPKKESRLLHYCHICNKGFKDKYSVNVHVRTHTGEKPFSCHLCGKCFRQKAHLAKHQQTHASKQLGDSQSSSSPQTAPQSVIQLANQ